MLGFFIAFSILGSGRFAGDGIPKVIYSYM